MICLANLVGLSWCIVQDQTRISQYKVDTSIVEVESIGIY